MRSGIIQSDDIQVRSHDIDVEWKAIETVESGKEFQHGLVPIGLPVHRVIRRGATD